MLVFEEKGKLEYPETEKPLGARMRTNNKLNPHMTPSPGIEPGPHRWEASALTTAPSLLAASPIICSHSSPLHAEEQMRDKSSSLHVCFFRSLFIRGSIERI